MTAPAPQPLRVAPLTGAALADALPQVAALRIAVFRAYPCLHDGDPAYEEKSLAAYAESPGAIVVGAWDGARLVGAATAAPKEHHAAGFAAPFAERGFALGDIFRCGIREGWSPIAAGSRGAQLPASILA